MKYMYFLLSLLLFLFGTVFSFNQNNSYQKSGSSTFESRAGQSQKPPGLGNPKIHKLTENVYGITGLFFDGKTDDLNAGIIFTSNSIIFIDAGMTVASGEYLCQIAEERKQGNKSLYLILTHHHADHTLGMRAMKERGAKIIAHKSGAEELENTSGEEYKEFLRERFGWDRKKADEIFGDVVLYIPDQVIEKETILNIDGEEIHLLATPGHHPDELSIYHPKSETLFAGDTIYEGMPLNTKFGGKDEWQIWISNLERLKQLEIKAIVPGHGNICSKEEIDRNIAFLREKIGQEGSR